MRVCLIGCGSIAWAAHGPALRRLREEGAAELAACCALNEQHAESFRAAFGFGRAYSDYEAMLRTERPDAVFALLPVRHNAACAVRTLEMGFPVIMEKPPGVNRSETAAILAAAERSGKSLAALFNRRSMPLVLQLRKRLQGEQIEAVSLEMCRSARAGEDFTTTAVHGIDCLRFLVGADYERLSFSYQADSGGGYVNYFAYGTFDNGVKADMRFLPCAGAVTERIAVYAKGKQYYAELPVWSGTTYAAGLDHPGRLVEAAGERKTMCASGDAEDAGYVLNGFYDEDRLALQAVEKGLESPFPVSDFMQSVDIAAAMRERLTEYVGSYERKKG